MYYYNKYLPIGLRLVSSFIFLFTFLIYLIRLECIYHLKNANLYLLRTTDKLSRSFAEPFFYPPNTQLTNTHF